MSICSFLPKLFTTQLLTTVLRDTGYVFSCPWLCSSHHSSQGFVLIFNKSKLIASLDVK